MYFAAFKALGTCRPVGMGVGAIPWLACMEYADRREWDQDLADILWVCIHEMDLEWLDWVREHNKKPGDAGA